MEAKFLGIDIGTQGARAVIIDSNGNELISRSKKFPLTQKSRQEQSPEEWWNVCLELLKSMFDTTSYDITAITVTSTSGTVIPLDRNNVPLHPAIMYSDKRAEQEGLECSALAKKKVSGYTGFNASSGISKMVWFANNYPEKTKKIHRWVHAADYITGKLSGVWGVTDPTNALKSGYDFDYNQWPNYLFDSLGLAPKWMPKVLNSGTPIGRMESEVAKALGLQHRPKITTGITDGCASQIASGAVKPGDWNTTIGTTLVIKGVTQNPIHDHLGRFYSHKHPLGFWMPGGASNTGADWITNDFESKIEAYELAASQLIPTAYLSYPLMQQGERFPFNAPNAKGFHSDGLTTEQLFTSNMEGVAYLERYAFELASKMSGESINAVYTAGGGSFSPTWLKIRANVLNIPIYKAKHISGAYGAAVLAASQTHFTDLIEAGQQLIQIDEKINPDKSLSELYDKNYNRFIHKLITLNYIEEENYA